MDDELVTLTKASEETGIEASTMRRAIQRGNLKATLYGKVYLVWRADLEKWINTPEMHRSGPKKKP